MLHVLLEALITNECRRRQRAPTSCQSSHPWLVHCFASPVCRWVTMERLPVVSSKSPYLEKGRGVSGWADGVVRLMLLYSRPMWVSSMTERFKTTTWAEMEAVSRLLCWFGLVSFFTPSWQQTGLTMWSDAIEAIYWAHLQLAFREFECAT